MAAGFNAGIRVNSSPKEEEADGGRWGVKVLG